VGPAAHGVTGTENHRPDKTQKDHFLGPGKGVAHDIPEKYLKDKCYEHGNKREKGKIKFKQVAYKFEKPFHVKPFVRDRQSWPVPLMRV
jgi:hypothetical protein